jgi:hypothetical protein
MSAHDSFGGQTLDIDQQPHDDLAIGHVLRLGEGPLPDDLSDEEVMPCRVTLGGSAGSHWLSLTMGDRRPLLASDPNPNKD